MLKNKQNKTEYPTFLGPINVKHYAKQWEDCFQAGHVGGRGKQISRLTWSTQWGPEQLGLHEDILPQTNKQQKDCSKSLILICYTAMNNHMPMYPVPFWALLSLTAWSCTAAQDNLVLRVTLSLCLLSLEIAGYSTPVFYLCLSTVFPNVHRGIQSSKWVTELLKSIFFCSPSFLLCASHCNHSFNFFSGLNIWLPVCCFAFPMGGPGAGSASSLWQQLFWGTWVYYCSKT